METIDIDIEGILYFIDFKALWVNVHPFLLDIGTKDDRCFCDEGWTGEDCPVKLNGTHVTLAVKTTLSW